MAPITAISSGVDNADLNKLKAYTASLLKASRFKELNSKLDEARKSRHRLPGGYWKLYAYFVGILTPNIDQNASDKEWEQHLTRLRQWQKQMPESINPHIALAQALVQYGWTARGSDSIDKVSDDSYRLFQERVGEGLSEIEKVKDRSPKCPHFYTVLLDIGLAQSWPKKQYESVFEKGFQIEPTYYHLPRKKVTYLLPQWLGEPGDTTAFISSLSDRIGGDEGAIMYFELTSTLWPQYHDSIWYQTGLDWKRVREGYFAMKRIYGVDVYRKNLFLVLMSSNMVVASHPQDVIDRFSEALQEAGNEWDPEIWDTKVRFDQRKRLLEMEIATMKNLIADRQQSTIQPVPQNR